MRGRRLSITIAVLAVVMLSGTACANVPLETKPQAIGDVSVSGQNGDAGPAEPEKDLTASDVVRDFVESNGQTANNYEASRQYLDAKQAETWRPGQRVPILHKDFNTTPLKRTLQPKDTNEIRVRIRGTVIGYLQPDKSFQSWKEEYSEIVQLRRQPETRQWRIIAPPAEAVTNEPNFATNHFKVPLYYFAPGSNVRVPDLRYVAYEPSESLPARVLDTLVVGPSGGLRGAVENPLTNATIDTNVRDDDGALEVPLTGIAGENTETRRKIVTQIVMSLDGVYAGRFRILSDGKPVLPDRKDWRIGDVRPTLPAVADNAGHAVQSGRLVSLDNGREVPAQATLGVVVNAAQSLEGRQLAVVERYGGGTRLRVGEFGKALGVVQIRGKWLSRPTWQPAYPGNKVSNEVWTVIDRKRVVRAQLTDEGAWVRQSVDTEALDGFGQPSGLRLSRDGTRAAVIADGNLVLTSVIRNKGKVKLDNAVRLLPDKLTDVVAVDWQEQDTLVVATDSASQPVVRVSVDGFELKTFSPANLEGPVTGVTATPNSSEVIAANADGLWTTSDLITRWQQHPRSVAGMAHPFYPG